MPPLIGGRSGGVARELSEVGVVGLGTMGAGIVEVFAAPAPLLEHRVTAGHLGRTTGRGFRDHPTP
jgi:3-hydroxyacyl-CoA dehydrogenase